MKILNRYRKGWSGICIRKKNRLWLWLVVAVLILAAGGIWGYQKSYANQEEKEEEIVLQNNQELVDIRITKMLGNEMTGKILSENREEEKTWLIPVGTEVVTKLGTTTTFARLSSGDTIQMLLQTGEEDSEDILKIWITQ